jgi:uncharacterized protein YbaR (Trm112 family)
MKISPDFIAILRCPACLSRIELKADGTGLKCVECRRVYPIRDEIPVLLVDESTIEDEETAGHGSLAGHGSIA